MKKPDVRFCTKEEVEKFKTHPYNREPDPKHIREIKKAMLKDLENFQAIQVNTVTMHCLDGEHRKLAALGLWEEGKLPEDARLKVEFLTMPEEDEYEFIVNTNTGQKPWNLNTHCESETKMGNENYIRMKELGERHSTITKYGNGTLKWRCLLGATKGSTSAEQLKKRTFKCTEEEIAFGDIVLEEVRVIVEKLGIRRDGQHMERIIASWSANRRDEEYIEIPFEKIVFAVKLTKKDFDYNSTNKGDFDKYFRSLFGYISSADFKRRYEKTKGKAA